MARRKGGFTVVTSGVPSRKGALRTIAAVHHQKNQAVATPRIRHIECRNGVAYDDREINCLLILGVRDVPNLEATPKSTSPDSDSRRKKHDDTA
jgi:hypothetical protein